VTDISDACDLMATARDALLADLLPALPKDRRYVGLMIANVMAIAAREYRLGPDAARNEVARLRNLIAESGSSPPAATHAPADVTALRKADRTAIRAGDFDAPERERVVLATLLPTAADWVAISNPKALRSPAAAPSPPD
jgi:hypothetical protein